MNYETTSKVRNIRIPIDLYQQIDSFAKANSLSFTSAVIMLINNITNQDNNLADLQMSFNKEAKIRNMRIPLKLYAKIEKLARKHNLTFTAMTITLLAVAIKKPSLIVPDK